MDRCDVLIVGGGPAGSSYAWTLRRSGLDVVILDQKPFPRDKVCFLHRFETPLAAA